MAHWGPVDTMQDLVRKTVKLGFQKTPQDYRQALEAGNFRFYDYTGQILDQDTPIAEVETEVDLVVVTPKDLGFKKEPTFEQICDKAKTFGLELCPREVGPALRLQYPDQPYGEWCRIAMEPKADSDGYLHVFSVVHDFNGRWLYTYWFYPQDTWVLDRRFVFVRPRM